MGEINHSERAHALLSASGAKRWIACPPSARLEDQFPDKDTEYSLEGTRAHELAERALSLFVKHNADPDALSHAFLTMLGDLNEEDNRIYKEVIPYVEFIIEEYQNARATHGQAFLLLEQRLDFHEYVPEGFGTGDAILLYGNTLEIIDLKFGKGLAVDANDNPQLRLYGIGALRAFGAIYEPTVIRMTIHQPRLDHVTTEEMPVSELLDWAETTVKPRAALAFKGEGEYAVGEHCRFCKAAATCRARADANLDLLKFEFQCPDLLTEDEVAEVLTKVDQLASWVNSLKDYALAKALGGQSYTGFKLVEGRSMRSYKDADTVAKRVLAKGVEEALIYERKLITLTAMEKLLGKKPFTELLGDLVVKPAGKPALVVESDPRPAYSPAESDFAGVEVEG